MKITSDAKTASLNYLRNSQILTQTAGNILVCEPLLTLNVGEHTKMYSKSVRGNSVLSKVFEYRARHIDGRFFPRKLSFVVQKNSR
jgi:hypothetical protein